MNVLTAAGDVQSDHHLVVGKVHTPDGTFPLAQEQGDKTVPRFDRLIYKENGDEFKKVLQKDFRCKDRQSWKECNESGKFSRTLR